MNTRCRGQALAAHVALVVNWSDQVGKCISQDVLTDDNHRISLPKPWSMFAAKEAGDLFQFDYAPEIFESAVLRDTFRCFAFRARFLLPIKVGESEQT